MLQPLKGLKVIELGAILAAPYAGSLLGDMGAEVFKIEPPTGDAARSWPPFTKEARLPASFLAFNRSKKSFGLDLKTEGGRAAYLKLAAGADIIIDNYRVGASDRLGLGYEVVKGLNPGVIYCSITGFGRSGPRATEGAVDLLMQAFSGVMSVTGEPGRPPVRTATSTADISTGMFGVIGILAALHERDRTGKGCLVEASLLEGQMHFLGNFWSNWLVSGELPEPMGSGQKASAPYQAFKAKDGYVVLGCLTDRMFVQACKGFDVPDLAQDPKFIDMKARVDNRENTNRVVGDIVATFTVQEVVERMIAVQVPCAPVNTLDTLIEDPQVIARGGLATITHSSGETYRVPRNPIRFNEETIEEYQPAPDLGGHTREILADLGYSADQIQALLDSGEAVGV